MSSADHAAVAPSRSGQYSAAQTRIITATLGLFAEHGVSGTSLQMIANAIGVTKAAVYHQFRTKEEIVLAVAEVELAGLEAALTAAETEGCTLLARESLLTQVVDLAVERRHMVGVLQNDPVMVRLLAEHEPFQRLMDRLFSVLTGEDLGPEARVSAAMLSAAIGGAVMHPLIKDLDEDVLRAQLLYLARRLFQFPE